MHPAAGILLPFGAALFLSGTVFLTVIFVAPFRALFRVPFDAS
jgi:hypothetical protein